jgi:hypothetical protein
MSRKKVIISESLLRKLYYKEKKSKYKIGEICGCSFKTVLNRMREYGMEPLSRSIIQSTYLKKDFGGDFAEKAYMIGFRLGDLNVYKTAPHSEVIVARCNTTNDDQANLLKKTFGKYGKVTISKGKNEAFSVNCFLNGSFDFLMLKSLKVADWISVDEKCSIGFAAGYIDAEANIGVYDKRARLKIDTYDKDIIFWFHKWFQKNNIQCPKPTRIGYKGQIYDKNKGYKYNKDLWRVRVSEKTSLLKILEVLYPYLKHTKRRRDTRKAIRNIYERSTKH